MRSMDVGLSTRVAPSRNSSSTFRIERSVFGEVVNWNGLTQKKRRNASAALRPFCTSVFRYRITTGATVDPENPAAFSGCITNANS